MNTHTYIPRIAVFKIIMRQPCVPIERQWRIQRGQLALHWTRESFFRSKSPFPALNAYSPLCAFAIKYSGADTLPSAAPPPFKISGSATAVHL